MGLNFNCLIVHGYGCESQTKSAAKLFQSFIDIFILHNGQQI